MANDRVVGHDTRKVWKKKTAVRTWGVALRVDRRWRAVALAFSLCALGFLRAAVGACANNIVFIGTLSPCGKVLCQDRLGTNARKSVLQ